MSTRTYTAQHGGVTATRTTKTKAYTHTVWVLADRPGSTRPEADAITGPTCYRWSESAANANKYADSLRRKGFTVAVAAAKLTKGEPAKLQTGAEHAAEALRPGLEQIDQLISDRVAGLDVDRPSAILAVLSGPRCSKALAATWAEREGVNVRRSWSKAVIAKAAATSAAIALTEAEAHAGDPVEPADEAQADEAPARRARTDFITLSGARRQVLTAALLDAEQPDTVDAGCWESLRSEFAGLVLTEGKVPWRLDADCLAGLAGAITAVQPDLPAGLQRKAEQLAGRLALKVRRLTD